MDLTHPFSGPAGYYGGLSPKPVLRQVQYLDAGKMTGLSRNTRHLLVGPSIPRVSLAARYRVGWKDTPLWLEANDYVACCAPQRIPVMTSSGASAYCTAQAFRVP